MYQKTQVKLVPHLHTKQNFIYHPSTTLDIPPKYKGPTRFFLGSKILEVLRRQKIMQGPNVSWS